MAGQQYFFLRGKMGWIDTTMSEKNWSIKDLEEINPVKISEFAAAIMIRLHGISIAARALKNSIAEMMNSQWNLAELEKFKTILEKYRDGLYKKSNLHDLLDKVLESLDKLKQVINEKIIYRTASMNLISRLDSLIYYVQAVKSKDYLHLLILKEIGQRLEIQKGQMRPRDFKPSF